MTSSELYKFTETNLPTFEPCNIFFALDRSGSMIDANPSSYRGVVYPSLIDVLKLAVVETLRLIDELRIEANVQVNIGISVFPEYEEDIAIEDVDSDDIETLIALVESIEGYDPGAGSSGTPYDEVMLKAGDYFLATSNPSNFKHILLFVSDGLPTNDSGIEAYNISKNMINRVGMFSSQNGRAVDIFGFMLGDASTSAISLLDNTPEDSVVKISDNFESLYESFRDILIQENVNSYFLTNYDEEVTYLGNIYEPSAIGRSDYDVGQTLNKENLNITTSLDNVVTKKWLHFTPEQNIILTIFSKEEENIEVSWKGKLKLVKSDDKQIELIFESVYTSFRRNGLKIYYQKNCPYALYDNRSCKVSKEDFKMNAEVVGVEGVNITTLDEEEHPSNYFKGGMLKIHNTFLYIIQHSAISGGSQFKLNRPSPTLQRHFEYQGYGGGYGYGYGGTTVIMYPGCDRSFQTCDEKFENRPHFGGFKVWPEKNPYE